MVRRWNRLTSRGTVKSSLHEILRSPEEIRRGVKDPYPPRRSCRRAGTIEKAQTNGDEERTEETLEGKRRINGDEQDEVERLEQRMGLVEAQTTMSRDRDQDLLYLRSKLTDMEDRNRRDYIRLHGIPENEEGVDVQSFLRSILPKLTSLDFDPPIEFQRAHRVGPKRPATPQDLEQSLRAYYSTTRLVKYFKRHANTDPSNWISMTSA
ncbi:hypothetical protein NDU88_002523 [Pleurodeles waltl]|uniref:Uncharacterized protein n=1 Tax=Pleurodeles waltl TaxID=8319 RepID=A0AAV7LG49_PLEWA|nr:hypothetical protein NDU88_002523 [Pleurodeles waltl]